MDTNNDKQRQIQINNNRDGGPVTPEGKEISKLNATKHGLLSKQVVLKDENQEEYDLLHGSILEEVKPKGEIEKVLAERISTNIWRLKRLLKVEKNFMELQIGKNDRHWNDPLQTTWDMVVPDEDRKRTGVTNYIDNNMVEKIIRYEASLERGLFKAIEAIKNIRENKK